MISAKFVVLRIKIGQMKFFVYFIIIFSFLISCKNNSSTNQNQENVSVNDTTLTDKKDRKFTISSKIVLTKHAQCRMECRKISLEEIKEIITKGKVNPKKSEPKKKPCPVLAIEGITVKERRKIRVVLAACKEETKIITVIDLNQKEDDPNCKKCK